MDKFETSPPWIKTIPVSLLPWLFPDLAFRYKFCLCILIVFLPSVYRRIKSIRQSQKNKKKGWGFAAVCSGCGRFIPLETCICPSCGRLNVVPKTSGNKKTVLQIIAGILILAVVIFLLVFFSGKFNYDVKHKSSGDSISIGMKKTAVGKITEPDLSLGILHFYYDDMTVSYVDGKVERIDLSTSQWQTKKGIHVGDRLLDVYHAYGQTDITDRAKLEGSSGYIVSYFLDRRGEVCSIAKAKKTITFYVDENMIKITRISISKR